MLEIHSIRTRGQGILAKAVAYLNVDSAVSGPSLRIKATPTLAGLIEGALGDVEDPASGGTLLDAWSGQLQMLGAGSDYAGKDGEGDWRDWVPFFSCRTLYNTLCSSAAYYAVVSIVPQCT